MQKLNFVQQKMLKLLDLILTELNNGDNFLFKILKLFRRNGNKYRGVYLHGTVGSGKTMIMRMFFNRVKGKKKFLHYYQFMELVHLNLKFIHNIPEINVIAKLASVITEQYKIKLFCIDEFEIRDITDAMLVMRLFQYLIKKHVFIFTTNNIAPSNLYKDGIQYNAFKPFIEILNKNFLIYHFNYNRDYRISKIHRYINRVLYPINQYSNQVISDIKTQLNLKLLPGTINIIHKNLYFKNMSKNILFTDFNELFNKTLGYADYMHITQYFRLIILENIRIIEEYEENMIIKFINFIDSSYFNDTRLYLTLTIDPKFIYISGKYINEFQRTLSRIYSMNNVITGLTEHDTLSHRSVEH
ncbi:cell division protein ZapE [Rickettsia endosymbiont of Cardiosporidium cionae]|uniref:cell division protein ZapE n=1 Tax=Rickettsia endosymbiont of Cardiosporidium cionae TaxID=2777155 RepID=UPI001895188E|nr:cell division protein ZapE [Rickettsia endosymbiont of Cardiosporidium cionae]KAF8818959.1 AFG1 family ATPase [Rickettsia endosymbiont of Cardiosporidium cionae]